MVAVAIALALLIAATMPLMLARRNMSAAAVLAMSYGAIAVLTVGYHVAGPGGPALASTDIGGLRAGTTSAPVECRDMMELLERGGVILDRANPARIIIDQSLWNQLPPQAHSIVETCIESERSPDDDRGPVQFVASEG